jgi:hypothetical protein
VLLDGRWEIGDRLVGGLSIIIHRYICSYTVVYFGLSGRGGEEMSKEATKKVHAVASSCDLWPAIGAPVDVNAVSQYNI